MQLLRAPSARLHTELASTTAQRDAALATADDANAARSRVETLLDGISHQHTAQEAMLQRLRSSTSWRLTMPLRAVGRFAKGELSPKEFCRVAFHRSASIALDLPGIRKGARALHQVMPGPTEWLARRYRIYGSRYGTRMSIPPVPDGLSAPSTAGQFALPSADLSPQETRFCHLIASARR
jgi:hypothetical protein